MFTENKEIIEKNIAFANEEIYSGLEKRQAHIVQKMSLSDKSVKDVFKRNTKNKIPDEIIDENKGIVTDFAELSDLLDTITAIRYISENEKHNIPLEKNKEYVISYMKNGFTDKAYSIFSELLPRCKVKYSENYGGSCEDVYYGRAECCILPLESSDEGIISGFSSMINKFELKIALTCNIEDREGHFTKYALIKRDIGLLDIGLETGIYLRISFSPVLKSREITDIFFGAGHFGLYVNRVDSEPKYYSENEYLYDIVFEGKNIEQINCFLTWLECCESNFELRAVYCHIR